MGCRHLGWALGLSLIAGSLAWFVAPPAPEVDEALAFFRTLGNPVTPEHLASLVNGLGHESPPIRERSSAELTALAGRAQGVLNKARHDGDAEVRRRAEACLRHIEASSSSENVRAAARTLGQRRPPGAATALARALPALVDEKTRGILHTLLTDLTRTSGSHQAELAPLLKHPEAAVRAGAGLALGHTLPEARLTEVIPLLTDPDPPVRRHVGLALCQRGRREAVAVLIALVEILPRQDLWEIEDILYALAGPLAPSIPWEESLKGRQGFRQAWDAWWQAHQAMTTLPPVDPPHERDHTLLLLLDDGVATELDAQDRPVWRMNGLAAPLDIQVLTGERLLLAESGSNLVCERHPDGTLLWSCGVGTPLVAQRVEGGLTFIATRQELVLVDRAGTVLWQLGRPGQEFFRATRLPDGDIACVVGQRFGGERRYLRLSPTGVEKQSFRVNVGTYGGRLDVRPNGHVLVPELTEGCVVEYGLNGEVVSELRVSEPIAASRLANGNTLVTSMDGNRAVEFDPIGKEVWEYRAARRVNRAYRR